MKSLLCPLTILAFALMCVTAGADDRALPKLKVSDNKRFLVTDKGEPFF